MAFLSKDEELDIEDQQPSLNIKKMINLFDSNTFDSKIFIQDAMTSRTSVLMTLHSSIQYMNSKIRSEIIVHLDDLIIYISNQKNINNQFQSIFKRVTKLKYTVKETLTDMNNSYSSLDSCSKKVKDMQETCKILKLALLIIQYIKRLQHIQIDEGEEEGEGKSGNNNNKNESVVGYDQLYISAQIIHDIENILLNNISLYKLNFLKKHLLFINNIGKSVRSRARRALQCGLEELHQADLGSSLHIFYVLNELYEEIIYTIQNVIEHLTLKVQHAFSVVAPPTKSNNNKTNITTSSKSGIGNMDSLSFRTHFWNGIEELGNEIHMKVVQIITLQRVILKKRDARSNISYNDIIAEFFITATDNMQSSSSSPQSSLHVFDSFWESLTSLLSCEVEAALRTSSFLQSVLVNEFPRLYQIFESVFSLLEREHNIIINNIDSNQNMKHRKSSFFECITSIETSFLSLGLSKLQEPITIMFASVSRLHVLPTRSDVDVVLSLIRAQIEAVFSTLSLAPSILKNVSKAASLFVSNCQDAIKRNISADSSMIRGSLPSNLQHNFNIYELILHFDQRIHIFLQSVPHSLHLLAMKKLESVFISISEIASVIISPLLSTLRNRIEKSFHAMHFEKYDSHVSISSSGSVYIEDIRSHVETFCTERLSLLPHIQQYCISLLRSFADRIISVFIRHSSLVSPISEEGSLKLTNDASQMVEILSLLIPDISKQDELFMPLTDWRHLLFFTNKELSNSEELHRIPVSVVIHHLLSQARRKKGGSSAESRSSSKQLLLTSPHLILEWSLEKYLKFVDSHTENEVCLLLSDEVFGFSHSAETFNPNDLLDNAFPLFVHPS